MITLACDTSGKTCSAALLDGERILAERVEPGTAAYSTTFLPMVIDLLSDCGMGFAEVGRYACTLGPGSFTGIRIGIATVQGMAYASDRPAIGVPTLEALAWPLLGRADTVVCPVLDARNGRVYAQAWLGGPRFIEAFPPAAMQMDAFLAALSDLAGTRRFVFCGDAAETAAAAAAGLLGPGVVEPPAHTVLRAGWVGQAALAALAADPERDRSPANLQPVYLGRSQAERSRGIDASGWSAPGRNR
ncbi:MAG: tRNA (adenosine(37)-N6)-threonylcarbamoyltransferase complex dimerization subunit type 1 TsaB [Clostridia bacterium]|nr:tRNA (adenosine(37)-N6)-threonylcarbamoyltransferase complex dimerization subunit type 1 TsaB [Clostridia bacterium]